MGVEKQLLIFSSCLSPGRIKKLHTFLNFCLKFGMKTTYLPVKGTKSKHQKLWAKCTSALLDRSTGTIDLQQLGLTVVVLISGAFVQSRLITNGVTNIGVMHLPIAVPTITCFRLTLRVIHKLKRTSKGQFQHRGMVYALNL